MPSAPFVSPCESMPGRPSTVFLFLQERLPSSARRMRRCFCVGRLLFLWVLCLCSKKGLKIPVRLPCAISLPKFPCGFRCRNHSLPLGVARRSFSFSRSVREPAAAFLASLPSLKLCLPFLLGFGIIRCSIANVGTLCLFEACVQIRVQSL